MESSSFAALISNPELETNLDEAKQLPHAGETDTTLRSAL
jgi:hypothetical protein